MKFRYRPTFLPSFFEIGPVFFYPVLKEYFVARKFVAYFRNKTFQVFYFVEKEQLSNV